MVGSRPWRLQSLWAAPIFAQCAAACTTARGSLADRLEAFDRQLVEGVAVVGELRADLVRRDAEVVLLRGQIDADRALMSKE